MQTAKHTPGPWKANRAHPARANDSEIVIEQDGGSSPIAFVHPINTFSPDGDQALANARLIEAAPYAFDALKKALKIVDAYRQVSGGDGDLTAAYIREVIRQGTGEEA